MLCCNHRVQALAHGLSGRRLDRGSRGRIELEVQKVAKAIALHFGLKATTVIVAIRSDLRLAGRGKKILR